MAETEYRQRVEYPVIQVGFCQYYTYRVHMAVPASNQLRGYRPLSVAAPAHVRHRAARTELRSYVKISDTSGNDN